MDEELDIADKPVMLTRRTHKILKFLNTQREDKTFNDTVLFALLKLEDIDDITKIVDKTDKEVQNDGDN
jgi:hypothetical protein